MESKPFCMSRDTALALLEALSLHMKAGAKRDAINAVAEWIRGTVRDDIPKTPEERRALIQEIETELRDCMSKEEREAKAAFYYGIPPRQDFNIVILPLGSDCMKKEGGSYDK